MSNYTYYPVILGDHISVCLVALINGILKAIKQIINFYCDDNLY